TALGERSRFVGSVNSTSGKTWAGYRASQIGYGRSNLLPGWADAESLIHQNRPQMQMQTNEELIMARYTVEALERFMVRTTYRHIDAANAAEAEAICRRGDAAYHNTEIDEGSETWVDTVTVSEEG